MKLDCELTRELYPQYQDGDLSSGVRRRVDEHLETCDGCRQVFAGSGGFKLSSEPVPPSLDEKIALRLKVTKLKVIAALILVGLIVFILTTYSNGRRNLYFDVSKLQSHFEDIAWWDQDIMLSGEYHVISSHWYDGSVRAVNDMMMQVRRNLNFMEKKRAGDLADLHLSFQMPRLIEMLYLRSRHDVFSDRDRAVMEQVTGLLQDIRYFLNEERLRLRPTYALLDTATLAAKLREVNSVIDMYYYYGALPGEMKPLTDGGLGERVREILDWTDVRLEFSPAHYSPAGFSVYSETGDFLLWGMADRYTGVIIRIDHGDNVTEGGLLDPDRAQADLAGLLARIYGPGFDFDIEYMGINYGFSGNIDIMLHTFYWTPFKQGYRIACQVGGSSQMALYNAHTGRIAYLTGLAVPTNPVDITENYTLAQGAEILELDEAYVNSETVVIESVLSDGWVLAHRYTAENQPPRYLNTVTGREEISRVSVVGVETR